jgi:hypothetical protein
MWPRYDTRLREVVAGMTEEQLAMKSAPMLGTVGLLGAFMIIAWRTLQPGTARKTVRYATVLTLLLVIASVIALGSRVAVDGAQQIIFILEPQLADVLTPGT